VLYAYATALIGDRGVIDPPVFTAGPEKLRSIKYCLSYGSLSTVGYRPPVGVPAPIGNEKYPLVTGTVCVSWYNNVPPDAASYIPIVTVCPPTVTGVVPVVIYP
jgi:hypothetical protein